jgi:hypothetical protein
MFYPIGNHYDYNNVYTLAMTVPALLIKFNVVAPLERDESTCLVYGLRSQAAVAPEVQKPIAPTTPQP